LEISVHSFLKCIHTMSLCYLLVCLPQLFLRLFSFLIIILSVLIFPSMCLKNFISATDNWYRPWSTSRFLLHMLIWACRNFKIGIFHVPLLRHFSFSEYVPH
jgi:hypothetical protein